MTISAVTLFCEDLREEIGGTDTLVGIFGDNVQMAPRPIMPSDGDIQIGAAFPKLATYTRILLPVNELYNDPIDVYMRIQSPESAMLHIARFDLDFISSNIDDVRSKGGPLLGLIAKAKFSPFPVSTGRILALIVMAGVEYTSGSLNIIIPEAVDSSAS